MDSSEEKLGPSGAPDGPALVMAVRIWEGNGCFPLSISSAVCSSLFGQCNRTLQGKRMNVKSDSQVSQVRNESALLKSSRRGL